MMLFIDCYDSFSYNLIRLIESACDVPVVVCHNDQITKDQLKSYLPFIEAIILGPGPGNPKEKADSGVVSDVWDLVKETPVPIFGVCFGFQSMVYAFGGEVKRMHPPKHGQVAEIVHDGQSRIFKGIPSPFNAVRYHSLHVSYDPEQVPLRSFGRSKEDDVEMAAEHTSLPIFAVQFHPESVLSDYGNVMFKNFWTIAQEFNSAHRQVQNGTIPREVTVEYTTLMKDIAEASKRGKTSDVHIRSLPNLDWLSIAKFLEDFVLLKSAAYPGEWSVFGVLEKGVTPHIRSKNGTVYFGPLYGKGDKVEGQSDFWKVASDIMMPKILDFQHAQSINEPKLPFLGGLIGYVSYEGGSQSSLNNGQSVESGLNSDASFVYADKSIQINEASGKVYAVGPKAWTEDIEAKLAKAAANSSDKESKASAEPDLRASITKPDQSAYNDKFAKCFEKLEAGDSYELCLTTQTELEFAPEVKPWDIFLRLISRNPAPYCSFMNFDDCLIASSPERFMNWDDKVCEFRPIKGTVRKGPNMTKEKASEILRTPKEQGENLMIVDLIRHDLGHLLDEVEVKDLMVVEEYETVYQLVTGIQGHLNGRNFGIDILSQSLPPGSMTGAPKKRSVEILEALEEKPRGIYSGVHGYWSIDDTGDWSVVIRSLFQSRLNKSEEDKNIWKLGAGGAVTVLSTAKGEFDEMNTKMDSVLQAFDE